MAFLSDVLAALVSSIGAAVWPHGTGQVSVAGVNGQVFEGWPQPVQLTGDLKAGRFQISVFPQPETERNTTRYQPDWKVSVPPQATLAATMAGQTIAVAGSVAAGQVVAAVVGGKTYAYGVLATDTLASVAAGLAALIAAGYPGTAASGAVITLPATAVLQAARVAAPATAVQEIRRELREVMVTVWAPTPAVRDALGNCLDVALSTPRFLSMPDETGARIRYVKSRSSDVNEKVMLYRRDMIYELEWGVTNVASFMQMVGAVVDLGVG